MPVVVVWWSVSLAPNDKRTHGVRKRECVRLGVILDFDKDGQVVGGEFLGIKATMPEEELSSPPFQTSQLYRLLTHR